MGKNKSGKGGVGGGKSKKGESSKKKCTCDHPYQCSCGNRPERPSRGHKWDPEKGEWGGKGHKQKGASGQTASVAQADKVTSVGSVVLKQWQKLPTRLLGDLCKKNGKALGRGMPIYRPVGGRGGGAGGHHRFRVIIPDSSKKGSEHDIVLTPALSVSNEEQAREEAALLGLLYLFPKLPHERTLPEPYRSTYLAAVKNRDGGSSDNVNGGSAGATKDESNLGAAKGGAKSKESNCVNGASSKKDNGSSTTKSGGVAAANTSLAASLPSFHLKKKKNNNNSKGAPGQQPLLTKAQVNEARKQHKREVQARIRKHEAIRNANKPMEVFMSARFRRRIECLLSGGVFEDDDEDFSLDPAEDDRGDDDDVVRSYVHQRLVQEGFASSHILKAYREAGAKGFGLGRGQDEQMDGAYEETLQYLCIHLREDQLPIGFDPRGGTLDVLRPAATVKSGSRGKAEGGGEDNARPEGVAAETKCDAETLRFAEFFGLNPAEASAIRSSNDVSFSSTLMESEESTWKRAFWEVLTNVTSLPIERTCFNNDAASCLSGEDRGRNEEAASNEREALEAIFEPGQVSIRTQGDPFTSVNVALPFNGGPDLSMEVLYVNGAYPDLLPAAFLTTRKLNSGEAGQRAYRCGGRIHLELTRYLSEMVAGQEVIFELYGHLQSLLQEEEANSSFSSVDVISELLSRLNAGNSDESHAPIAPTEPTSSELLKTADQQKRRQGPSEIRASKPRSRPRQGSTFWNTRPNKTPPAEAFPKLSMTLARARGSLPAARAREKFLSLMAGAKSAGGRVVLVTGETGCGKTTQIPQFILENSPNEAKIVVAQPRRLAATGVACRVALERGESAPGRASVGYVVRGDSKMCPSTRLMFCTTGVLLRQLQSEKALENITHILVDEVHERHLDTDVLLVILKSALPSLPNLTVVLMSATMDADRFAKYWGKSTPRMHIPGFTHPVRDFTLEDVLEMTSYIPPKKKKKQAHYGGRNYQAQPQFKEGDDVGDDDERQLEAYSQLSSSTCAVPLEERLKRMNESEIDYDLVALLVRTLLQTKEDDGSILVFLPGAGEIDRAERTIQQIVRGHSIEILPLHGGLQAEKQQRVFVPARKGFTKVILSTNVAETSITIPDCTIVVDTCKEKQSSFDPVNRMPLLLERFASQDSLKQRRGRAGRVRPGTCYKLISKSLHNKLPEHGEPEIRRCALDQTILSLLFLGLEDGTGEFLRLLLDPPSQQSIDAALYSLEKTGALYKSENRVFLTPLGSHLAGIPAPPQVGKLLVMGTLLGCRDMAVAIAAGMSAGRSPFLRMNSFPNNRKQPPKDDNVEQEKELINDRILAERAALFKMVGKSDHAMLGKVFINWKECQGHGARKKFCNRLGLAFNSMRDILALVRQLDSSLTTSGFVPSMACNRNGSSWRIVRSMIVASLSPTQVVRVQRPSAKYTETVEGSVEKAGNAKELKFFIRGGIDALDPEVGDHKDNISKGTKKEERVFIHPSSSNFSVGSYSCPWLVYHRLVRTSKAFVSDATECNPYSLLLFGGAMEVQASKGMIVLDDWIRLSANARIGSLIGGLREKVDELLENKVSDPSLDISGSSEMKLITDLLRHDGV